MSFALARQRAAIFAPRTASEMACTASKSPGEAIGKPASMMSTPSRSSWRAIRTFSPVCMLHPGDCSPSRSVVSKTVTRAVIVRLRGLSAARFTSPSAVTSTASRNGIMARRRAPTCSSCWLRSAARVAPNTGRPASFSATQRFAYRPSLISSRIRCISFFVSSVTMRGPAV